MTKKILNEVFSKSKATKSLIGIYERDIKIDDFCVGHVIGFDETFVAIQHVTKYGAKDGIHVKEILTIEKVETESDYLKACQVFFDNQEILPIQTVKTVKLISTESWQYHFFNDNSCIGELIAFSLKGESLFSFGFLIDFDEDYFTIHLVGQSGESQGINVYHIIDLASLGIDTLNCRKRKYLYNLYKNAGS